MGTKRAGGQGRYPTRGFGSMDPAKVREISSLGGKAVHEKGTGHEWTSEEASEAGRVGGRASAARKAEARAAVPVPPAE